jgi:Protein of unknown function (DUF1517)
MNDDCVTSGSRYHKHQLKHDEFQKNLSSHTPSINTTHPTSTTVGSLESCFITIMIRRSCLLSSLISLLAVASSFVPTIHWGRARQATCLDLFDKVFEEEGPLGKGITVGKVQVSLLSPDRSGTSIYGLLERKARSDDDSPYGLARMTYDVCMALLRKSEDWIGADSTSQWFKENDSGKAESKFNEWCNREATKFEKVRRFFKPYSL